MTLATRLSGFCTVCLVGAALSVTLLPVAGQGNATKKANTPKKTKTEKEQEKQAAEAAKKKGLAAGTSQGQPSAPAPTSVPQNAANSLGGQTTTAATGPSPLEESLATARALLDAAQKRSGSSGYDDFLRRVGEIKQRAAAPPDVEAHLKALSIGMIRLGDALQAQAETVQKSAAEKSELKALLAQQEVSDLRDAAAGPAALVVDLGSGRDKLAAAPKTNTRWDELESALKAAQASAQGNANVWAAAVTTLEGRVREEQRAKAAVAAEAERERAARALAEEEERKRTAQAVQQSAPVSTQQGQGARPGVLPDNPNWVRGNWRRADGDDNSDSPNCMEISEKKWKIYVKGEVCELSIRGSVFSADGTGVVTLTGAMSNGNEVVAGFNPMSAGSGFALYLKTERLIKCIYRDASYVRMSGDCRSKAVVYNANVNSTISPPHPPEPSPKGSAVQPICDLAGTHWESDDKDKPWLLFFGSVDQAGNFDANLSPKVPALGATVKLRVQCNGPGKAYLSVDQDNGAAASAEMKGDKKLELNAPLPNKDKGVKKFIRLKQ